MSLSTPGNTLMMTRISAARMRLNKRFSIAQRLPARLEVSAARRFGVTAPMAAPMIR